MNTNINFDENDSKKNQIDIYSDSNSDSDSYWNNKNLLNMSLNSDSDSYWNDINENVLDMPFDSDFNFYNNDEIINKQKKEYEEFQDSDEYKNYLNFCKSQFKKRIILNHKHFNERYMVKNVEYVGFNGNKKNYQKELSKLNKIKNEEYMILKKKQTREKQDFYNNYNEKYKKIFNEYALKYYIKHIEKQHREKKDLKNEDKKEREKFKDIVEKIRILRNNNIEN